MASELIDIYETLKSVFSELGWTFGLWGLFVSPEVLSTVFLCQLKGDVEGARACFCC